MGRGVITFDAADTVWSAATITARAAVVYYSTGVASTSPLLLLYDYGENITSTGADWTAAWASQGMAHRFMS
jgi:hypothetical protein